MGYYNSSHLSHFICVKCRIGSKSKNEDIICPQCKLKMTQVGITFRIPRKTDDKGWKEVEYQLLRNNHFYSKWKVG